VHDVLAITRGQRVRHRREIWFASLAQAASTLNERRLHLLSLVSRDKPRSVADLARLARRPIKGVETDVRLLADLGLLQLAPEGTRQRPVATFERIHLSGDIPLLASAAA
jgi:predicted transcriptional regulator